MTNAYVLMTALPPTYGHLDLIQFASLLDVDDVVVILGTQPDEPFAHERYLALCAAKNKVAPRALIVQQHEEVQQEPRDEDDQSFWDDWVENLRGFGFEEGDYIVASEKYGIRLAKEAGGQFMPYDMDRWVRYTKGTSVREDYYAGWDQMIPEFREYLVKKVTIFGAESTGKTTLTNHLADIYDGKAVKLFEWARPYLETTGPEVTVEGMHHIMWGQSALQTATYRNALAPLVVQDTDLYTTIGFWEDWSPETVPEDIYWFAGVAKSDLYIITRSNIPFEYDILRDPSGQRQTDDQYWIDLCEKYDLPYVVLDNKDLFPRVSECVHYIDPLLENPLNYKRQGVEYQ